MAKNPFTSSFDDPVLRSALNKARFGKRFSDSTVQNIAGGYGARTMDAGFELADATTFGAKLSALDQNELAKRFGAQLQGGRPLFTGQGVDLGQRQANIDISDLMQAQGMQNPTLSLQNLLGADTEFSRGLSDKVRSQYNQTGLLNQLGEEQTAQAFIDAIRANPNAGDPTASFSGLEGAPSLAFSELQKRRDDPFSYNVLNRIANFTDTYNPDAPNTPMGQEQQRFDAAVAEGVAADEVEAARVESGGYDDSALRTQLREQQELLRQMSSRLEQGTTDQGSMQDAFSEFIGAQQQGVSADVMSQLLSSANQGRVSATDIQNIVNASSEGRLGEQDISRIIGQQLVNADIRGQVGEAVKTEFGDVLTEQMVNRTAQEKEQFESLLAMLNQRQQAEERIAREGFARQDAIRREQESAVGETIDVAEQAGRDAYGNVRGLPLVEADFSATEDLRQTLEDAITQRIGGTDLDAIRTERLAQLDEDAGSSREALTEQLNRLGLLRAGGDTADVLGEFEGQVVRGRQGIEADLQQMQQDLITQGITSGTTLRQGETTTEMARVQDMSRQMQAARDLDIRRNMLQQEVADRTLGRGLTRLGPTERERFENQLRSQKESEYLSRSELSQRTDLADAALTSQETENRLQRELDQKLSDDRIDATRAEGQYARGQERFLLQQSNVQRGLDRNLEKRRLDLTETGQESELDLREKDLDRLVALDAESLRQFDVEDARIVAEAKLNREQQTGMQDSAETFQAEQAILDRQLQENLLSSQQQQEEARAQRIMENTNEQQLAERNLRESESNFARLQQTAERTAQENFQRGLVTREEAQRQSDRTQQITLADKQIEQQNLSQRLQREHEFQVNLESRNFQNQEARRAEEFQNTQNAFQRGMITSEAALDRTNRLEAERRADVRRNAENQINRDFQVEQVDRERDFTREQNLFVSQQNELNRAQQQLDRDAQVDILRRQQGFQGAQNLAERQLQLTLLQEQHDLQSAEAKLARGFTSQQNTADRQQQLVTLRENFRLQSQQQQSEQAFQRELQSLDASQRQADRDLQTTENALQRGVITSEAALDRSNQINAQSREFQNQRSILTQQFNQQREQNQFLSQERANNELFASAQADLDRAASSALQANQLGFERLQRSADRGERQLDRDEAARFQIAQQGFEGAQRKAERTQQENLARLSREQQGEQFARAQDFTEEQADQDALYRAIGTLLAAQEGGMDLGIGQREAAPGGLEALLRGQLGRQLDIDLTNFGPTQQPRNTDVVTDFNPPKGFTLIQQGEAQNSSGDRYTYNYNMGGWEYNPSAITDASGNPIDNNSSTLDSDSTESNRRGGRG